MAPKVRFTSADCTAMVRELGGANGLRHLRVANIYDIDDKTYLFKFALAGETEKLVLLIESGIRLHTTKFQRSKNELPSPFAMKLRKYIRTKRLESITQPVAGDRLIQLTFGSGEAAVHVLLEFYANGNIILTDSQYEVLALLRSHQFEQDVAIKVGEIYPIRFTTSRTVRAEGDTSSVKAEGDTSSEVVEEEGSGILTSDVNLFQAWAARRDADHELWQQTAGAGKSSKKGIKKMMLKQLLLSPESGISHYGPEILEHVILSVGLAPSLKVSSLPVVDDISALLDALRNAEGLASGQEQGSCQGGYCFTAPSKAKTTNDLGSADSAPSAVEYSEFSSILLKQHEGKEYVAFSTFCDAVDAFFFKVEAVLLHKRQHAAENAALKKLAKVKSEAENHVKRLEKTQENMQKAASLVSKHAENIDKCLLVLKSALDNGMAWRDVEDMVAAETARGNPIASMVKSMRLEKGRVVLQLPQDESDEEYDESDDDDSDEDDDDEEEIRKPLKKKAFVDVDIDLTQSAHANARSLFTYKKAATQKQMQTIESSSRAVAAVESATLKTIEGQKMKQSLRETRKVHWFERFHWFISSDGHLVLSGKDAQQNELLVKKYLRKGDVYVHAEVHGAASCIVRYKDAKPKGDEASTSSAPSITISPSALQEAGQACVCRSHAWTHKQISSAYWVLADQVSKSAPSGEYLTTGSFMIYGKKNFLPPLLLEMGFGIMFRLDDASIARHLHARSSSSLGKMRSDEESSFVSLLDRYGLDTEAEAEADGAGENVDEEEEEGEDLDGGDGEEDEEEQGPVQEKEQAKEAMKEQEQEQEQEQQEKQKAADAGDDLDSENDDDLGEGEGEGEDEEDEGDRPPAAPQHQQYQKAPGGGKAKNAPPAPLEKEKRGKNLSKKKARRYAEQDEEDKALVLQALGHTSAGGKKGGSGKNSVQASRPQAEQESRRLKAGVKMLAGEEGQFAKAMERLPEAVRALLLTHMEGETPSILDGEISADELVTLSSFSVDDGVKILQLFAGEDGVNLQKKGNKSAFLAGVIRRFAKENSATSAANVAAKGGGAGKSTGNKAAGGGDKAGKGKAGGQSSKLPGASYPDAAEADVQAIMEEEGINDEEEGKLADEVDKLSGFLFPDDVILYSVPVCGPYSCLRNFKYKVKLTPGVTKKGKALKVAVDAWTKQKECGEKEKAMIRGMNEPECVAVLLGEVRVSMPGLHGGGGGGHKKQQRGQKGKSTRGM